jgi:LAO/AO transport system kinase
VVSAKGKTRAGTSADISALAARVLAAEPVAVAKAISVVEDRRVEAEARSIELLRALVSGGRRSTCQRIGITGPPGVGKSSLVAALATSLRASGRTLGVLAVDPSSPRSGGSLLGDRARMVIDPEDDGLYVRSMASGGDLGGLARAAGAAVEVLSSVYDVVLIETTGVGQSETDVEHVADTVAMVIQPGSGDVLQFLKAGILEIPDVFVVNKSDLGRLAQRARTELQSALTAVHAGRRDAPTPAVVSTSATQGAGVEELVAALDGHFALLQTSGELEPRRAASAAAWALRLFTQRYGELGVEERGGKRALAGRFEAWIAAGATAVEAISRAV